MFGVATTTSTMANGSVAPASPVSSVSSVPSIPSVSSMPDTALRDELCTQAAHLAVAECHFVLLLAEFDRRELWGDGECRSCAHWLNWRCGTSLAAAREQVRVGRALERLHVVREAFATGELSYSKVRAITRIADAETEKTLLHLARNATASQLERIVREYRKAHPDEGREALERHRTRYVRSYTDEQGMVVIHARLSPEDAAAVLAAIELARRTLDKEPEPDPSAEAAPAAEPAGVAPTEPTESSVAPPAVDVSAETSTLETTMADALVAVCESVLGRGLDTRSDQPKVSVLVHLDEQVARDPTAEGCSFIEGVGAVSSHTARRLACDAAVSKLVYGADGRVEPEGRSQSIPRRIRRAVLTRDRGCRFPGCTQRVFVDVHHVVFRSRQGPTVPSNLVCLCRFHHRRVHEGGYRLNMNRSGAVRVWTPDGDELPQVPAMASPGGPCLKDRHRRAGLRIGPDTLACGHNDPLDLDMTMSGLHDAHRSS